MTEPRERRTRRPNRGEDDPVLPDVTADERDVGWGDERDDPDTGMRDERWYREQRPPHHE